MPRGRLQSRVEVRISCCHPSLEFGEVVLDVDVHVACCHLLILDFGHRTTTTIFKRGQKMIIIL